MNINNSYTYIINIILPEDLVVFVDQIDDPLHVSLLVLHSSQQTRHK